MIHFGVCVGPGDRYLRECRPTIERTVQAPGRLLEIGGATSIFEVYREFVDVARRDGADALVLLHDDVAVLDRNFLARIRRRLREPDLGVLGAIGGRGLRSIDWGGAATLAGRVATPDGVIRLGPLRADVDAVDGLLLVLTRTAMERVTFDTSSYSGFHGYDVDVCLSARAAGLRVGTEPFDVLHHSAGDRASADHARAAATFAAKWAGRLEPEPFTSRDPRLARAAAEARALARLAAPLTRRITTDAGRLAKRATSDRRPPALRPPGPTRPLAPPADTGSSGGQEVVLDPPSAASGATATPPSATPGRCPTCHIALDASPTVRLDGAAVHRCRRCGLGVTTPPPDPAIEGDALFEDDDRCYLRNPGLWRRAAEVRLAWIQAHQPDGLLLELGSASGELLVAATRAGYEAVGVEPSRSAVRRARAAGAEVVAGTLDDWIAAWAGITVDVVVLFHVLEHLPDPVRTLQTLRRVTREGGSLLVEVPNAGCASAQADAAAWPHWSPRFHHTHHRAASLRTMLDAGGWEVESSEITMRPYLTTRGRDAQAALVSDGRRRPPEPDLLRAVARAGAPTAPG